MAPLIECAPCILKWTYERAAYSANEMEQYELMRTILGVLSREFTPSGNIGFICNRCLDAVHEFIVASSAHYTELKVKTNQAVDKLLPSAREFIKKGERPRERFERACCLAADGNVSPIGAPSGALEFPEAEDMMLDRGPLPVVIGDIYRAAQDARHVLFLTDNAGEIGFDALLLEELKEMGLKVTLAVKDDPFFEDATINDAVHFGMDRLAEDILTTKGVFLPAESTQTLYDAYRRSDLVIAKGIFNFEALNEEVSGKPTIYMLKIKCDPISKKNNLDMGKFMVKLEKT
jgi:uncharacterized protein with ATP-grasp and redox domains